MTIQIIDLKGNVIRTIINAVKVRAADGNEMMIYSEDGSHMFIDLIKYTVEIVPER